MRFSLVWNNTFQNKKRAIAALSGITFSILLIFMQLGFLDGGKKAATLLYTYFDFDLVIVSDKFMNVGATDSFERTRLFQALTVPGVKDISVLNIGTGNWEDTDTEIFTRIRLVGIDLNPDFIWNEDMKKGLSKIDKIHTVLMDKFSTKDFGNISAGEKAEINGKEITIVDQFQLGMIFLGEGWAIVSNNNFSRLAFSDPRKACYGLIKVTNKKDIPKIKGELKRTLPGDVMIFEQDELIEREQDYFISVKPIGMIFKTGVFASFMIGLVILFQILSTDISNRLKEYATLKAMGFTNIYIYSIGIGQALLMAFLSYIPSLILAFLVFHIVYVLSHLPMKVTFSLALFVLLLSFAMSSISSIIALQKVREADPAELF